MMGDLGKFEGTPVVASKVIVRNAGDGLTKPLAAEPRKFKQGERAPMLLWGHWGGIDHEPVKEGVGVIRVQDFVTEESAVLDHVDARMLDELMASQREAVRLWELEQKRLKDESEGAKAFDGLDKGGPVDGGPSWSERALAGDGAIEVGEATGDGSGEALPEMTDADWEGEARSSSVSAIGSKQARKAKG